MNYAEDRLDRRARNGRDSLRKDFSAGVRGGNHELLGRTLRDVGWNRRALYHYATAWREAPDAGPAAAGDYAQMADLAGFPEVGVLALLTYRSKGKLRVPAKKHDTRSSNVNGLWLEQRECDVGGDCGCGDPACGQSICYVPMEEEGLVPILEALEGLCSSNRKVTVSANDILRCKCKANREDLPDDALPVVPKILAFWEEDDDSFRPLPAVLQLLLIKLLYSVVPSLAAQAVVLGDLDKLEPTMSAEYKSHWAYYVLIRAVVLGERIKPHRRLTLKYYHCPVWDLLFGLDQRNAAEQSLSCVNSWAPEYGVEPFLFNLRQMVLARQNGYHRKALPPLTWWLPATHATFEPLYIVGDSHVLSLAWQTLYLPDSGAGESRPRLAVPVVTTGIKAWHVRRDTRFFTRTCLDNQLHRLPSGTSTIILSAGEIDCREGMGGPLLQGYTDACHEHVQRTVREYVRALSGLAADSPNIQQILVMPVAPHTHNSKGKVSGRASRRETMRVWNEELRLQVSGTDDVFFLDYWTALQAPDQDAYVLNPAFNADSTHLNAAFMPLLEQAIIASGCNLDAL
jgi:hypothetical protein